MAPKRCRGATMNNTEQDRRVIETQTYRHGPQTCSQPPMARAPFRRRERSHALPLVPMIRDATPCRPP
eukprot:3274894-Alexandrium_andersonii.AAC.1